MTTGLATHFKSNSYKAHLKTTEVDQSAVQ